MCRILIKCTVTAMPAASPAFNYTFARQDDVVKFGFTVSLNAPPPPPARHLITK